MSDRMLHCPYHHRWIRLEQFGVDSYRTCPECSYCIHCTARGRPVYFPHKHGVLV